MATRQITPNYIAAHIRRLLKHGGSTPHAEDVQWFFKEVIQSRGWRTAEMRKVAVRIRRAILRERGLEFLVQVADRLFRSRVLRKRYLASSSWRNLLTSSATRNFAASNPGSRELPVGSIMTGWFTI